MNGQKFYFRLGLFTLGGIALAIVGILLLGQRSWFHRKITVETYFDQSVSGLSVGAPVRHRGVDVGRVTRINFVTSKYRVPPGTAGRDGMKKYSMANLILVEMAVNEDAVKPLDSPGADPAATTRAMVKDGLRMKLVSSLLGGGGYIEADFVSDPDRYPPPTLPWVPTDIYIPSVPSATGQLMETLDHIASQVDDAKPGQILRHVDALVVDARRLTAGIDSDTLQREISALLVDLRSTTHSLQKILDDPHLPELLTNASGAAGNIQTLTDPQKSNLSRLIGDLRGTAGRINTLLDEPSLKQALANTGPLTTDARRTMARLAELLASEQQDLAQMIRSFRDSAQNIEAITDDAKQNPARILFGAPPPKGKLVALPVNSEK